jgi:solute carrier family 25 citrate transporter 1
MSAAAAKGKEKEKPIASLMAGATAGGVEAFITYPFESLKTQLQFGALNGEKVCLGGRRVTLMGNYD